MTSKVLKLSLYGLLLGIACGLYGFLIEPRMLKVRHVTVQSPNWTGESLRAGLITDIHMGGFHVDAKRVANVVARMNALGADIILLPGDFVNGHMPASERSAAESRDIAQGFTAIGALTAPLGVYAALGNHDSWYGPQLVRKALDQAGVMVLENAAMIVDERLCLVGLEDDETRNPNAQAYEDCQGRPIVSMMHSPDTFHLTPPSSALSVAGHTTAAKLICLYWGAA